MAELTLTQKKKILGCVVSWAGDWLPVLLPALSRQEWQGLAKAWVGNRSEFENLRYVRYRKIKHDQHDHAISRRFK